LVVDSANDEGTYKAGEGTVTVSYDSVSDTFTVEVDNRRITIQNCDIEITAPYDIWTNNSNAVLTIENSKIAGQGQIKHLISL